MNYDNYASSVSAFLTFIAHEQKYDYMHEVDRILNLMILNPTMVYKSIGAHYISHNNVFNRCFMVKSERDIVYFVATKQHSTAIAKHDVVFDIKIIEVARIFTQKECEPRLPALMRSPRLGEVRFALHVMKTNKSKMETIGYTRSGNLATHWCLVEKPGDENTTYIVTYELDARNNYIKHIHIDTVQLV
jgi:hypothetical protein